MEIKRSKWLRLINKKLITLPWGVYAAPSARIGEEDVIHESIHVVQQRQLLVVFFILWYGIEWVARLIQYRNFKSAYKNISFERQAYANENNPDYPKNMKWGSWIRYL